jgi:hypothetical protein
MEGTAMLKCYFPWSHSWSFPLQHQNWRGYLLADVETCTDCGAQRLAPLSFGPLVRMEDVPPVSQAPQPQEVVE